MASNNRVTHNTVSSEDVEKLQRMMRAIDPAIKDSAKIMHQ